LPLVKAPKLSDDPRTALKELAAAVMEQFPPGVMHLWPEDVPKTHHTGAVVGLDWVWRITILAGSEAKRVSDLNHESCK
jgi:hypothetical protein